MTTSEIGYSREEMMTVYVIIYVFLVVLLVLAAAVKPTRSALGGYELERLASTGDTHAKTALHREQLIPDVVSLQRLVISLLLVTCVAVAVAIFGWMIGIGVSVVVALEYGALGRVRPIDRLSNAYYTRYEPSILRFVEKFGVVFRFVRVSLPEQPLRQLHSREELAHLVEESTGVLSVDEKKLIINGLDAVDRRVEEVMTPRSVIDSIDRKEHLGPLVLDDLHKTGHSRFPVIDGDIDHITGILHVRDLLEIDARRKSTSVEKAMEPRIFYIKQEQTLEHALAAFLRTRHHLFIVINEFRETVGIVTLEDVMEAMLGRKIIDEFDTHEDLRKVAARNPRRNNRAESSTDV